MTGLWTSRWPAEDGGARRLQVPNGGAGPAFEADQVDVTSREAIASTMVVLRDAGEVFLLRHTLGADVIAWVERLDPLTLEPVARSADLPAGPMWPGGLAAHANGSLHVVFGNHAHRLSTDLEVLASRELPRPRPYNSFVVLPDGTLVTKDFGGRLPVDPPDAPGAAPAELLALHPESLEVLDACALPEPSIARLSADGDDIYAVGTTKLFGIHWNGTKLVRDETFAARYRTIEGQTYGWDPVLALGAAWFLDNGEGSERYAGTFHGQGTNTAPLHLVRVDLASAKVTLTEICGLPNGLIANPPLVDEARRIVVGYDSGNGVMAAFDVAPDGSTSPRWRRDQDHACHLLLFPDTGELVTNDHDAQRMHEDIVVLDIETGAERVRVPSGGAVQSVVFPAAGFARDVYCCSFSTVTRISARV